jgi:hypothetical protein
MRMNPKYIKFEYVEDIIDYLTKGFPPSECDFNSVMLKVLNPDEMDDTYSAKKGKEVLIPSILFKKNEIEILGKTLLRVYKNKIKSRNRVLIGFGVVVVLAFIGKYFL